MFPALLVLGLTLQSAPPKPPTADLRGRGGDGDDFRLEQVDRETRQGLLSLWLWQAESSLRRDAVPIFEALTHCQVPGHVPTMLREMLHWEGDTQTGGFLSKLKGRQYAAKLGDELLAVCLIRYELDTSSVASMAMGRHTMVVDAIALEPPLYGEQHRQWTAEAGLQRVLTQLAACHQMRIAFSTQHESGNAWKW